MQYGGNNWIHHNIVRYTGLDNGGTATLIATNCAIPNGENANVGIQEGTNNIVEWNTLAYSHGDFVDWFYDVGSEVRYNVCFHSGMATAPLGTGLKIHHNIFNMDNAGSGILAYHEHSPLYSHAPDAGPVLVYNNIVHNYKTVGLRAVGTSATGVVFRNNILVTTTTNVFMPASLADGVNSDYNVYYYTVASLGWRWNSTNVASSLAAFQSVSGQEAHSIYADPQFVSASPVTAADFQLKSTSPCVNAGQDLKTAGLLPPAQEYNDCFGTPIPRGFRPEIGPYEAPAPDPPTELHVINQ